jgi:hypothetical protein
MSPIVVLGLLWAAGGIALGNQWWHARAAAPPAAQEAAAAGARFGQADANGSWRRLQAMRRAYAFGAISMSLGFLTSAPALLALGAAMVNLGTMYRYMLVALDQSALDTPLLIRSQRAAVHVARHARLVQPNLGGALVGRLAE